MSSSLTKAGSNWEPAHKHWIWRRTTDYGPDETAPNQAHPRKVMIWGAVGYNFKGPLQVVHATTVDWKYYHDEIICGGFLNPADRAFGYFNWVLMQDNAHPHVCKRMMKAFTNMVVQVLPNWPPYSPDLDIIETIWVIKK
jgi:hypothetical protein